jgi:hypothetical protein
MIGSRIFVGLAVLVATTTPFYLLSKVTFGIRYGIITKIYDDADIALPLIARLLWPLGALDWWSYIAPVAFAVGVAARIRTAIRSSVLAALLGFGIAQSILIFGAFAPFSKFGEVMGYPVPAPYPVLPFEVNVAMVVTAVVFATFSIKRNCNSNA